MREGHDDDDKSHETVRGHAGAGRGVGIGTVYPSHQITNGEITATVYLPDAKNGFYKTTRFDWSGAIGSLKYKGHDYYGTWWSKITDIYDFGYEGPIRT